jgi:hypothetical protein
MSFLYITDTRNVVLHYQLTHLNILSLYFILGAKRSSGSTWFQQLVDPFQPRSANNLTQSWFSNQFLIEINQEKEILIKRKVPKIFIFKILFLNSRLMRIRRLKLLITNETVSVVH